MASVVKRQYGSRAENISLFPPGLTADVLHDRWCRRQRFPSGVTASARLQSLAVLHQTRIEAQATGKVAGPAHTLVHARGRHSDPSGSLRLAGEESGLD